MKSFAFSTLALLVLGGCATLDPDAGFAPVQQATQQRLGSTLVWARSEADRDAIDGRVAELLREPLSADAAVQLALLNNAGLQARFHELGIAQADLLQASLPPNPGFSFGRLRQGSGLEIDRGLHINLARWLTLPMARQIEARNLERSRGAVTVAVLQLAAQTRRAHTLALAAEQTVGYMRQVRDAAEAGAELARRQAQTGNWSRLQQAREQGFYADAMLNLARAEQARVATRELLTRLLGLWGEQVRFRLPERLPDLPKVADELPDIEQTAMAQRLDVAAAKQGAEQLAANLGLVKMTRFVNVLELGALRNTFRDAPVERGYELSVELPLFDWGTARVAKAEAIYRQALSRTAETAINARSEVRAAYAGYRSAYDIARHYRDEIVPLRKRIADENLLRYNGMLIGVFELLADARAQIGSVNGAIEAQRDFWLAQAELDMALIGPAGAMPMSAPAAALPTITSAADPAH